MPPRASRLPTAPGFSDAAPVARRQRPATPAFSDGPRRTPPASPFSTGQGRSRPAPPEFREPRTSSSSSRGGDRNRRGRGLTPAPPADDKYRSRQSKTTGPRFNLRRGTRHAAAAQAPVFQQPGQRRAAAAPVFSSVPRDRPRRDGGRASAPTFRGGS